MYPSYGETTLSLRWSQKNKNLAKVMKSICKYHQPDDTLLFGSDVDKALNQRAETASSLRKSTMQGDTTASRKETDASIGQGGPRSPQQAGSPAFPTQDQRFLQRSTKEGRRLADCDQPEVTQFVPSADTSLQDGNNPELEGCSSSGRLHLKDAYLTVPVHQDDHRYLRFTWKGKHSNSLNSHSVWHQLHQVTEASCILPSASRNQVNRLPRRYPDNGLLSREGNQRSASGITDSGSSRVHQQHEEMTDHSNTDDRIPGVHIQLPPHGALSPQGEGLPDKEGVQHPPEPDRGVKSLPCSPDQSNDSQYPSDSNSPYTLSGPSETPDKRTAWQSSELRPQSPDVRGRSHGPDVVEDQGECPDTTPNSPTNGITQPGNRRLDSRMGCVLSGVVSEDRRTLVESRGSPTHQLAGIDGGIPGRPMFCQSSQRNSHPTLHGQPGGDSVCESSRRNALKEPVHTGTGILGVVRAQENHSPCGAHPRQEKRDSGPGVTPHVRLQRLATGSGSLHKGSSVP